MGGEIVKRALIYSSGYSKCMHMLFIVPEDVKSQDLSLIMCLFVIIVESAKRSVVFSLHTDVSVVCKVRNILFML